MPAIAQSKPDKLTIACSGGVLEEAYRKAYFGPYAAASGIAVERVPNPYAKLKAMVEANSVEWDVCQMQATQAAIFAKEGLLEPLDYSMIDKSDLLPNVAYDNFIANCVAASVASWNTRRVPAGKGLTKWADLWDLNRFSGQRALWKRSFQTFELALLADGVIPADLYPLDIDRALASLGKIKSSIYWWDQGAQITQLLINGEVPAGMCWNGRLQQPKLDGAPVDFTFEQSVLNSDAWIIPKGAKNKKHAMEFIAFSMRPENQASYSRAVPYGPVNKKTFALLDDKLLATLPSSDHNFSKGVMQNVQWWADNGGKATERFNAWLLG